MNEIIERLTDTQVNVLKALATYKFLTYSQLVKLGIGTKTSNLNKPVRFMWNRGNPYVGFEEPAYYYKNNRIRGRLEGILYLKPHGIKILEELGIPDIKYQKGKVDLNPISYAHQKGIIDCEIALRLSGLPVLFVDSHIDWVGNQRVDNNLVRKTRIEFPEGRLEPDMIFMIEPHEKYLYSLEYDRGDDTKEVLKKIDLYKYALWRKAPSLRYGLTNKGSRVLWVFEQQGCMNAFIERIRQHPDFSDTLDLHLCKTLSQADDFIHNWRNLNGDLVTLF